MGSSRPSN